jgi:hypothetical protein
MTGGHLRDRETRPGLEILSCCLTLLYYRIPNRGSYPLAIGDTLEDNFRAWLPTSAMRRQFPKFRDDRVRPPQSKQPDRRHENYAGTKADWVAEAHSDRVQERTFGYVTDIAEGRYNFTKVVRNVNILSVGAYPLQSRGNQQNEQSANAACNQDWEP